MNTTQFFSDDIYTDKLHYPNGFYDSQDFSEAEADILTFCGNIVSSLVIKSLVPQNIQQQRVLDVIEGKKEAIYFIEKVFLKYYQLINK